jgi:Flp pilus assembly protein TadG
MGLVMLLLVALAMGIVDFGRMLLILNIVTNTTRDAARNMAVAGGANRCANGGIANKLGFCSAANGAHDQLLDVGVTLTCDNSHFAVQQCTLNGENVVRVTTTVAVNYIGVFAFLDSMQQGLTVTRTVTFRDELGSGTGTGCAAPTGAC